MRGRRALLALVAGVALVGACTPGEGASTGASATPFDDADATTDDATSNDATSDDPAVEHLFDGTAASRSAWRQAGPGEFELDGDALRSRGGMGLLWHPAVFTDVVLSLQWRSTSADDNSGVFVGVGDPGEDLLGAMRAGHEVQIYDADTGEPQKTGSIYGEQPPTARTSRPPGEWNDLTITVRDGRLEVDLNGEVVNTWTDPDGDVSGHVGLQNHSDADDVSFRDVRVRRLEPS